MHEIHELVVIHVVSYLLGSYFFQLSGYDRCLEQIGIHWLAYFALHQRRHFSELVLSDGGKLPVPVRLKNTFTSGRRKGNYFSLFTFVRAHAFNMSKSFDREAIII